MASDLPSHIARLSEAERFHLFVANVTDYAIYMLSPEGKVDSWNAGAERIKGYREEEIVGQHFSRFYTEEDRASGLPARALEIARREGRFESEGWRVRKDGSRFWAHVVVDAIRNDMGELIGFAKITRDITERREAAAALERANEALLQSQKLEAIGQLTGGIAHDFNNLLGVIITGIELLSHELTNPAAIRVLDTMQRAATRGSMLTQQLLSFARRRPLKQDKCDLNQVIRAFEIVLRGACNDSIRFQFTLMPQSCPVMADISQFEAALLNLVVNARDAMPAGGILTVMTEMVQLAEHEVDHLPAGRFVKLSVRDTGGGMPPEVMSRAIEPFFTTKGPGKGTGLGLSQVYGLVQQSGGDIVLESKVGKGTNVSLYLPMLPEAECEDMIVGGIDRDADKALVVDDQQEVLQVATALFRNMGYSVLSASNGREAIEILNRNPDIELLFSDVRMPDMSGIALGQEARRLVPGIRVLLASGYPEPALAEEKACLRDFDLIYKPYRMVDIMKKLRKIA